MELISQFIIRRRTRCRKCGALPINASHPVATPNDPLAQWTVYHNYECICGRGGLWGHTKNEAINNWNKANKKYWGRTAGLFDREAFNFTYTSSSIPTSMPNHHIVNMESVPAVEDPRRSTTELMTEIEELRQSGNLWTDTYSDSDIEPIIISQAIPEAWQELIDMQMEEMELTGVNNE